MSQHDHRVNHEQSGDQPCGRVSFGALKSKEVVTFLGDPLAEALAYVQGKGELAHDPYVSKELIPNCFSSHGVIII